MKPDLTLVTNTVEFAGFPVTRRRTPNSGVNSYVGICCPFPEQTITISISVTAARSSSSSSK
jgi:hypothetical protein